MIAQILSSQPSAMLLFFILALIITATGFFRVVYFVSLGYTFAIVTMGAVSLWLWHHDLTPIALIENILLMTWGIRLGFYILLREYRESYRREMKSVHERESGVTGWLKVAIWIGVSLLYVCMYSPAWFSLSGRHTGTTGAQLFCELPGLILMAAGIVIETVADWQKASFKNRFPKKYCDVGLYRWVRSPNYFGEILVWSGNWLIGVAFFPGIWQWAIGTFGWVCLVLIMMGSTKRLERSQETRYGALPEFQAYAKKVPILFPWLQIYTLKKVRVYIE